MDTMLFDSLMGINVVTGIMRRPHDIERGPRDEVPRARVGSGGEQQPHARVLCASAGRVQSCPAWRETRELNNRKKEIFLLAT